MKIFLFVISLVLVSCNGQKKAAMSAEEIERTETENLLELVMQEEQGGFETDEMLVIRDAKRLKSFFSKINRTRKPGLPVPDIDFLKDMIIIQCSDGKSQSNTTFLSVVKETDTQIILISNGLSDGSDTEKIKSYGSFSIYKMPASTKEILLDKQIK